MHDLPRGVAVVHVTAEGQSVVLVNSRLSPDHQLTARILAAFCAAHSSYVMLTCAEVLLALRGAS